MNVNIRQKNILVFIGFSAFFLLFLRTQPASSAPNLVAEYHFDETSGTTTADSSGNGNNGTLVNGPVWTTNGKIGSALVFDGVNDYVDAGNSPSLNPANQITIAAWAKPSSIAQSQFIVAKDNVPAGTLQYFLRFQGSSGVRFAIRTSVDNYFTVSTPTAIATNTWYHVVGVYDGSTMKVYVNGTLLGSTNVSGLMANNGVNVRIGRRQDTALPFNGVIDEVKIYDRALSQSEVMGLYDNTSPSTPANLTATAVSASQISLSWQASTDNVAVTGYQVFRDGLQIATTTTTSYSSTGLQPSTLYTYTTSAFDGAGNISAQSVSAQATTLPPPDTTPPVVSVTSPLSGATVSGTIPISANATDNVGVAGVQFKLDGANLSAEDATLPYGISWDTATASEGLHTLTAVARDAAGNSATSTPISVTVDNIPPDITPPIISNISSSANISDATITWTTDELADSQVEYGTTQTYGSSSVLVSTFTTMHSVNITNLSASATYHYRVKSKDPSGNLAVSGDFMFNTQSPPPPPGPVGYWKLDDASGTTTADSSGNGNNGSLTNGPVWTTGKVNGGLSFDGVDDYVLIPNSPSLSPTTAITLTAWVNISNTNTTKMIVAKYDSTGASYFLRVGGSRVRFNVNAGGTLSGPPDSATLLSPNTWYHIVGTYDGTQAKLYINGLLNTSIAKSGAINVTSLPVNIGRHGSNLMFMQGLIDEVRVYDRALSQSEVTALYNFSGTPSDTQPPSVSITSPAAASSVAGTIKVDVSASDNVQVASVELYKDNQLIARDATAPYELFWSPGIETNAPHVLTAKAIDTSGNSSTSAITVAVNNPPPPKYDIIFLLVDDYRYDAMVQYMPLTASLIGNEFVKFDRAFMATPICCPSRASILSGEYSHNSGVLDNTMPMGGVKAFKDASSIATWLHSAGYRTGLFGKYLNEYELSNPYFVPPGWDDWRGGVNAPFQTLDYNYSLFENGVLVPYGSQPQDYGPDVLSAKIVKFIEATPTGQPLFAYFAPQNYTPANVDIGTFSSFPPIRLPSFNEADVSDKPVWVQKLAPLTASQISIGDGDVRRSLESLQSVDRGIASIIDALKRTGRYNNTVIVLTSDNGMSYGEHRWSSKKWCVYEECIRAPLWVRVPGVPGRMENNLTVNVDFAPTFSEWAGAIPQTKVDGLSMATLFKNASSTWPTERLVEYLGVASGGSALLEKSFHAVRTPQSVYAEYDNGDKEFYDLVTDPYQMDNVVNNLNYTTTISNLKKVLDAIKGL